MLELHQFCITPMQPNNETLYFYRSHLWESNPRPTVYENYPERLFILAYCVLGVAEGILFILAPKALVLHQAMHLKLSGHRPSSHKTIPLFF